MSASQPVYTSPGAATIPAGQKTSFTLLTEKPQCHRRLVASGVRERKRKMYSHLEKKRIGTLALQRFGCLSTSPSLTKHIHVTEIAGKQLDKKELWKTSSGTSTPMPSTSWLGSYTGPCLSLCLKMCLADPDHLSCWFGIRSVSPLWMKCTHFSKAERTWNTMGKNTTFMMPRVQIAIQVLVDLWNFLL